MAEVAGKPWPERRPEELERLRAAVRKDYPNLHLHESGGIMHVRGSLALLDDGREIDRFFLDIELSPDYPASLSRVFETANRIPRDPDRHVNVHDGSLCIGVEEAIRIQCSDLRLPSLLEGPIKAFLLGTMEVEHGRPWPYGSWDHGDDGIRQFYAEHFQVHDVATLQRLAQALRRTEPKWQKPCPCLSGNRLRDCHGPMLRQLREKVPDRVLRRSLELLARG